jgi:ornithine decarboxylase
MGNVFKFARAHNIPSGALVAYKNVREVLQRLKPEQPVYLFNRDYLVKQSLAIQAGFPGKVAYAVKANARNRVLRTLVEHGIRDFDVASVAEIRRLMAISPNLNLHFNNPVKSRAAIEVALLEYGVRSFALDDSKELEKIISVCEHPEQLLLSVRFKLLRHQAAYNFGSKFGATPKQAARLLRDIQATGAQAALTFHPGSQCTDPDEYRRYIHAAADITSAANVVLAQLNVGGGFPEYYVNTCAEPRLHYFDVIQQSLGDAFEGSAPPVMCEPGRAMIASCISLLVQVIHVREGEGSRTAFINDGVYGGLQEQNMADFRLPIHVWRKAKRVETHRVPYTVFGPTCDPSDRLPRTLDLPLDLKAGDYLEFGLVGAYGSATATTFNGFDSQQYVNVRES